MNPVHIPVAKGASDRFAGTAVSGAVTLNCVLYDDGSVEVIGNDQVIDEGTWERGAGLPELTLEKGTATISAASATEVNLVYMGDIGTGSAGEYEMAMESE